MLNTQAAQPTLKTVLVVDDDEFSQAIFQKKLGVLGFNDVRIASNGREGVRTFDLMSHAPDFLICDIFMPDMDGIELVGELANRGYMGGLILVTGVNKDMLEVAGEIAEQQGLRVLGKFTKPVQQDSLEKVMLLEKNES